MSTNERWILVANAHNTTSAEPEEWLDYAKANLHTSTKTDSGNKSHLAAIAVEQAKKLGADHRDIRDELLTVAHGEILEAARNAGMEANKTEAEQKSEYIKKRNKLREELVESLISTYKNAGLCENAEHKTKERILSEILNDKHFKWQSIAYQTSQSLGGSHQLTMKNLKDLLLG